MSLFDVSQVLVETNPVQGYTAYAVLAGTALSVVSAVAQDTGNPTVQEFVENGAFPGSGVKAQAIHAAGTALAGGTIEFDLNDRGGGLLSLLDAANRGTTFSVVMGTPSFPMALGGCYMETITLRGAAKQLVTGNVGFKSTQEWQVGTFTPLLTRPSMVPYWLTGNTAVKEWAVNIVNPLRPVYKNSATDKRPRYLRVGKTQGTLQVTTVGELRYHDTIGIGIGSIVLTGMVTEQSVVQAKRGTQNDFTYTLRLLGPYTSPPPGGSGGPATQVSARL